MCSCIERWYKQTLSRYKFITVHVPTQCSVVGKDCDTSASLQITSNYSSNNGILILTRRNGA